ncbi:MAG: 3-oxoacyl-[acyl-carrier-protein] synthase [Labilithrix sp.]|nr:3-oxoacyl-[acyl-carrier-protein] synthase [Labilithrix sp.]
MSAVAVVAYGALSGLGEGEAAVGVGAPGEPAPRSIARDPELEAAGLSRPFCARVPGASPASSTEPADRATMLLDRALAACTAELDVALPGWRARRVGLALGTSSGGMRAFEAAFAPGASAEGSVAATYIGPVVEAERAFAASPFAFVLGACASGTLAVGLGREWLRAGACDVVLCGGFDAVSVFVASGFEVLRATCSDGAPRPFRTGRDGLALGEGAAVLALVRADDPAVDGRPVHGYVTGFGASCDAVHLTAPDREGQGLARAGARALVDAGDPRIDLVSAHATATEYNDAAEARALLALLGPERLPEVPVHALKGGIGHTLGAAGALETLAALTALGRGVLPASAGEGALDGGVRVLGRAVAQPVETALKLSAAFGGANAALVVSRSRPVRLGAERPVRDVFVSRGAAVTGERIAEATTAASLAARTRHSADKLARADLLVRLAVAAVADLRDALGPDAERLLDGAGTLVGHGLATMDTNASYLARIQTAGPSRGEPRRFPYTTPNAPAGECAVAFGLTGPSFAVGCGLHGGLEALAVAADLVRGGVAERMVVVAVDEAGAGSRRVAPGTEPGAVAVLVASDKLAARLVSWESTLPQASRERDARPVPRAAAAHAALLPLASGRPDTLSAPSFGGGFARARFFWL